jgi:hypothetical protein
MRQQKNLPSYLAPYDVPVQLFYTDEEVGCCKPWQHVQTEESKDTTAPSTCVRGTVGQVTCTILAGKGLIPQRPALST